jgi:hypothetical protein
MLDALAWIDVLVVLDGRPIAPIDLESREGAAAIGRVLNACNAIWNTNGVRIASWTRPRLLLCRGGGGFEGDGDQKEEGESAGGDEQVARRSSPLARGVYHPYKPLSLTTDALRLV